MTKTTALLGGLSAGAALMYLLDPIAGRRRRARIRDKAGSASRKVEDALGLAAADFGNRACGVMASMRHLITEPAASDSKLVGRARSKLGRYSSHPRAIHIEVHDGHVTLSGAILANEAEQVLRAVNAVAGVKSVDNRMEVHEKTEDMPALQGGRERKGEHYDLFQESWAPATRLMVFIAALSLSAYGLRRGGIRGSMLVALSTAMMAEAASNKDLRHLFGRSAEPTATQQVKEPLPEEQQQEVDVTMEPNLI